MQSKTNQRGQSITEYAVLLFVLLLVVVGALQLVGHNANTVFSSVSSALN